MTRFSRALPVLAFLLALLPALAAAGPLVRVGVYLNPPKIDLGAGGRPQGIFIDVVEAIARAEGWTLQYVPGSFAQGLQRLASGEIDLMPDVARTPQREQVYGFHRDPVLTSWGQVYARPGHGIRTILDLSGRRVAVLEGSVQQQFFQQYAGGFGVRATLLPFADYGQAFEAVRQGRADAVVGNSMFGTRNAAGYGLEDTAILFAPSGLYFAAPRTGHEALLAAIDQQLTRLQGDPGSAYFASLRRWLPPPAAPMLPPWARWALAAAALLLAAGAAWAFTLHRAALRLRASQEVQRTLIAALQARSCELQQSNQDLRTFSHSVSHDLRSPLAAVTGFVGKVLRDDTAVLPPGSSALLQRALRAGERMEQLIEDLLRLARVAEHPVHAEEVDLSALAGEVLGLLQAQHPDRVVQARIEPGLRAFADARLLRVALENLLSNALKFTGGTAGAEIRVGCAPDGSFFVADNGAGFDMDYADRLFQPFQRLHDASAFPGTGIGLSIVQRVVAHHGGRVWARGVPGEGATFWFTLAAPSASAQ